jgi:shikimate dehydrogenase
MTGATLPAIRRAGVVGWPIAHSRSPLIHRHWLARHGLAGGYDKVAVPPAEIDAFLDGLSAAGYVGCNVTVPHKEAAFARAAERDASAVAVGAANTLWLEDGVLHAANTDTYGFMMWLDTAAPGWRTRDAPVVILGAGGAARAIVYGFLAAGVAEVRVVNRTRTRAEALAAAFGPGVRVWDWADRSIAARSASVVVNTTALGLDGGGDVMVDLAGVHADTVVADIVYVPLETPLLADARRRGLATVDGLGMLLHQAVPGFERWFGVRPEVTRDLYDLVVADIRAGA